MKASSRIVVNTGITYGKMAITMIVALLSSRWVLIALGKEDFGIYQLVAGMINMLMFLNLTMSTASQRFLSFALGKKNDVELKDTFYFTCVLHFIIGILIFLFIEIIGVYCLNNILSIPNGKIDSATFILHCLAVSTFITVISVPYQAEMYAHENMLLLAVTHIAESLLKLFAAILLLMYSGPRLKIYALCMMLIPIISTTIYRLYCRKNYPETKFKIHKINNFDLFRQMSTYAGWNLIGSISSLFRTQGVSMMLNIFFGVVINAAYGIAQQVNAQLRSFSAAIVTAARPQIVKSEGCGDRKRMLDLSSTTCKMAFLLLSFFAIPIIVETPYILSLWLKDVPEYTVSFTRLVIILSLLFQFAVCLGIPIESVGNIKNLQIFVGGLHFLILPIGYIMLRLGCEPHHIFLAIICEDIIGLIIRLFICRKETGLIISKYLKEVLFPVWLVFLFSFLLSISVNSTMNESIFRLLAVCITSSLSLSVTAILFVVNSHEKEILRNVFSKFVKKHR